MDVLKTLPVRRELLFLAMLEPLGHFSITTAPFLALREEPRDG
jgi:hypothetical protein